MLHKIQMDCIFDNGTFKLCLYFNYIFDQVKGTFSSFFFQTFYTEQSQVHQDVQCRNKHFFLLPGWVLSSVSVLSGSMQCGPHSDEGKVVGVWETLMSREVERSPCERAQAPLRRGAVYCLCDQLGSHLVVCHLDHEIDG